MQTMKYMLLIAYCVTSAHITFTTSRRIVCYWDLTSLYRTGPAAFTAEDARQSCSKCTHLILGTISIADVSRGLTTKGLFEFFRANGILSLTNSSCKIYLGIGNHFPSAGLNEPVKRFLNLLKGNKRTEQFIENTYETVRLCNFDGIDLSWQFPSWDELFENQNVAPSIATTDSFHTSTRSRGTAKRRPMRINNIDDIREFFVKFVVALSNRLLNGGKRLTLSVLPHTNIGFYDIPQLLPMVQVFHLLTIDYRTPMVNPRIADYPAPLFPDEGGLQLGVAVTLRQWMDRGAPSQRLIMTIPTFARTWMVKKRIFATKSSPPYPAERPGRESPLLNQRGILARSEICRMKSGVFRWLGSGNIPNEWSATRINPTKGAYNWGERSRDKKGMWACYDDLITTKRKIQHAEMLDLGGIALYDIALDDFRGVCSDLSLLDTVRNTGNWSKVHLK